MTCSQRDVAIFRHLREAQQTSLLFLVAASSPESLDIPFTVITSSLQSILGPVCLDYCDLRLKVGVLPYGPDGNGEGHSTPHLFHEEGTELDFTGSRRLLVDCMHRLQQQARAGEHPPSLAHALSSAQRLNWKGKTRIIVHLCSTAGNCHTTNESLEAHLQGLFLGCGIVRYYLIGCGGESDVVLSRFQHAAPSPSWVLGMDCHAADGEATADYMGSALQLYLQHALRTSLRAGVLTGAGRPLNPSPARRPAKLCPPCCSVDSPSDSWRTMRGVLRTGSACRLQSVLDSLQQRGYLPEFPAKEDVVVMKVADFPFHSGSVYRAYHGTVTPAACPAESSESQAMVLRQHALPWDVYPWIGGRVDLDGPDVLQTQCDISLVAKIFGNTFNGEVREAMRSHADRPKALHFPQVHLFQAPSGSSDDKAQSWLVEDLFQDYITGDEAEFSVASNGIGAYAHNCGSGTPVDVLGAASHYSLHRSRGKMLVVYTKWAWCSSPKDPSRAQHVATQPSIHSEHIFLDSPTNFGQQGIQGFLASHKCGSICHALGISPLDANAVDDGTSVHAIATAFDKLATGSSAVSPTALGRSHGEGSGHCRSSHASASASAQPPSIQALPCCPAQTASPEADDELTSLSMVSDISVERAEALMDQLKYHCHLVKKLRSKGYTQAFATFHTTILFAWKEAKIISKRQADRYIAINKGGNTAKHKHT